MDMESVSGTINSCWQKVEEQISLQDAMEHFSTQELDESGVKICLLAFELVSRALDQKGSVRRINQSKNTPLSALLADQDGPWRQRNKAVDRRWDYDGAWINDIEQIAESAKHSDADWRTYDVLHQDLVLKRFCEKATSEERSGNLYSNSDRTQRATFAFKASTCRGRSDTEGADTPVSSSIDSRGWESIKEEISKSPLSSQSASAASGIIQQLVHDPNHTWSPLISGDLLNQGMLRDAPSDVKIGNTVVYRWETRVMKTCTEKNGVTKTKVGYLEPYWMFDMKSKTNWDQKHLNSYKYNHSSVQLPAVTTPDLVLELECCSTKQSTSRKVLVFVEIDTSDKTVQTNDTTKGKHCVLKEKTIKKDPAKLALKLMQSTSVQASLQEHTYHIRSNFYSYLKDEVNRSLLNLTDLHMDSYQDVINQLTTMNKQSIENCQELTRAMHVVSQMYRAHIKIAFLIFMREVHGIDIRDGRSDVHMPQKKNDRMQDHHFFVNFTGDSLPSVIKLHKKTSSVVCDYLSTRKMLQSRVKVKVFDYTKNKYSMESSWAEAPVMSLDSSSMKDWSARVSAGQLQMFPGETARSIPVAYATVQRVDIDKLCEFVKKAADEAFLLYDKSRTLSEHNDGLTRRDFPDRCYLTRRQQLDRDGWWNKQLISPKKCSGIREEQTCNKDEERAPGIAVRRHTHQAADDLMQLDFGYETPSVQRDYQNPPKDLNSCKWDQVDVRMHFFSKAMKDTWKESANGMWYVDDYVKFFQMLQGLTRPQSIQDVSGKNKFTCQPIVDENKEASLRKAIESTKYRLRLHDFHDQQETIMKSTDSIDLFWQCDKWKIPDTFDNLASELVYFSYNHRENYLNNHLLQYLARNKIILPGIKDKDHDGLETRDNDDDKEYFFFFVVEDQDYMRKHINIQGCQNNENYKVVARDIIASLYLYAQDRGIETEISVQDFVNRLYDYYREHERRLENQDLQNVQERFVYHFPDVTCPYTEFPAQSETEDLAYHIFSVLSFFFDCRDNGACRYRWENWLLDYFGASSTVSEFHQFRFQKCRIQDPEYSYFNQTWFQMCFFLEHNFRNAVSALHYKLFDMGVRNLNYFTVNNHKPGLHAVVQKARRLDMSFINTRSSFAGLGNVSAGLSFRKYDHRTNTNLSLRHRILSQMDDELPALDPSLVTYVRKFRIPDAELFLRIIRCPNIIALHELSKTHLTMKPIENLQQVLDYFDPAIQSEIEMMLKFVRTDQNVYLNEPQTHPTKCLFLTASQLLMCMRQTVKCTDFSSRLGMLGNVTPLQCKYDMFLQPKVFHVLMNLFCTRELLKSGCQRPIKFVMLQLALVDKILKSPTVTESVHANDCLLLAIRGTQHVEECDSAPVGIKIPIVHADVVKNIPCVIGTSRRGWPQRDLNVVSCRVKPESRKHADDDDNTYDDDNTDDNADDNADDDETDDDDDQAGEAGDSFANVKKLFAQLNIKRGPIHKLLNLDSVEDAMTDDELRLWMLLAYARPRAKPEDEINVCVTQGDSVRNTQTIGDFEDIELHYLEEIRDNRRVLCCHIHETQDHVFFERCERSSVSVEYPDFPPYVKALIPDKIDRKLIYVPKACAAMLRRRKWPACFSHEVGGFAYRWRPVFVGPRTWCWKRLLIKTIFLHSFGKIATRSKTLLALYKNVDDLRYQDISGLLERANEITMHQLGDLSGRERWLPKEYRKSNKMHVQASYTLLVSLHEYQERRWKSTEGSQLLATHACLKNTPRQKQLFWSSYFLQHKDTLLNVESCRFMRVDKMMESYFSNIMHEATVHTPRTEDFFVHRDYLYLKQATSCVVVNANNVSYIKFPPTLAIRSFSKDGSKQTDICELADDILFTRFFFTTFDTRRCSWFRNTKLDSKDDMELVHMCTKIRLHTENWRTAIDPFEDRMQWARKLPFSTEEVLGGLGVGYSLLSPEDESVLYTMPDFQQRALTDGSLRKVYAVEHKLPKAEHVNFSMLDALQPETWMNLKGDSRLLTVESHALQSRFENKDLLKIMNDICNMLGSSSSACGVCK